MFAPAPLSHGTDVEYAAEKPRTHRVARVSRADGNFTLYEDENDNYDYEKGAYATIRSTGTMPPAA